MNLHDIVTVIASLVGSGGLLGSIYLLMKFRPEAGSIIVKSAEGVMVMQSGYIDKLEKRVANLEEEVRRLSLELKKAYDDLRIFRGEQSRHDGEIKDLKNVEK
jgi:hypothetical protein